MISQAKSSRLPAERPMSVRIIKQKQEQSNKDSAPDDLRPSSPVLIESTLFLIPDQERVSSEQQQQQQTYNASTVHNDFDNSSSHYRRTSSHRVHVPIHNASQWFNGPNMQNERSGRMEKVVSSLVRRSFRPLPDHGYANLKVSVFSIIKCIYL